MKMLGLTHLFRADADGFLTSKWIEIALLLEGCATKVMASKKPEPVAQGRQVFVAGVTLTPRTCSHSNGTLQRTSWSLQFVFPKSLGSRQKVTLKLGHKLRHGLKVQGTSGAAPMWYNGSPLTSPDESPKIKWNRELLRGPNNNGPWTTVQL